MSDDETMTIGSEDFKRRTKGYTISVSPHDDPFKRCMKDIAGYTRALIHSDDEQDKAFLQEKLDAANKRLKDLVQAFNS